MELERNVSRRGFLGLAEFMAAGSALALAGCSGSSQGPQSTNGTTMGSTSLSAPAAPSSAEPLASAVTSASGASSRSIIVLWSWSGNTLKVAERVSELSGAEIYRIEAADPYPEDYDATADRAKQEQDEGTYPAIANPIADWDDYDTVFIGYPIWWYQLPMIVQGFVKDHD